MTEAAKTSPCFLVLRDSWVVSLEANGDGRGDPPYQRGGAGQVSRVPADTDPRGGLAQRRATTCAAGSSSYAGAGRRTPSAPARPGSVTSSGGSSPRASATGTQAKASRSPHRPTRTRPQTCVDCSTRARGRTSCPGATAPWSCSLLDAALRLAELAGLRMPTSTCGTASSTRSARGRSAAGHDSVPCRSGSRPRRRSTGTCVNVASTRGPHLRRCGWVGADAARSRPTGSRRCCSAAEHSSA
jgi:hypothetical protein